MDMGPYIGKNFEKNFISSARLRFAHQPCFLPMMNSFLMSFFRLPIIHQYFDHFIGHTIISNFHASPQLSRLITLLASAFPPRMLFRIWDCFFTFGAATIFRVILAMFKLSEDKLNCGGGGLFGAIAGIPTRIERVEDLLEMAESFRFSVTDHLIGELRRKYQVSGLTILLDLP